MGGKYKVWGWYYPYNGYYDFCDYTNDLKTAKKWYKQCKKKYFCYGIEIQDDKNINNNEVQDEQSN